MTRALVLVISHTFVLTVRYNAKDIGGFCRKTDSSNQTDNGIIDSCVLPLYHKHILYN